ncbi:hypothetical protein CTA2_7999 [Colletotrichum tanaceti]|uniref:Uncharacterized protein n=1 Tax=Colletotrichum tanaceti TaxID=1306861 RepID=A0A4U6XIM3_9PEZI|nr:hypothetical protein CTA2_7999 [Colletotrichum tanaceti]TKW55363.1 hypothetical protein CTA1_4109 [Colletotrichum tanaceti]
MFPDSFVRLGKHDLKPATPRLFLEVKAPPRISLTLPYKVDFVLHRAKKDGTDNPCIVRWSPSLEAFGPSGLVLLRHATDDDDDDDGAELVAIDHDGSKKAPEEEGPVLANGQSDFYVTLAPGGVAHLTALLPERYYRALRAGDRYTLLYPGAEISAREWSTGGKGAEKPGRRATTKGEEGHTPVLVVPGGGRVSLTAQAEEPPWPGREASEAKHGFEQANVEEWRWRREEARKDLRFLEGSIPPRQPEERVEGAPVFSVTIECAPTIKRNAPVEATIKVTYDGICGPEGRVERATRPVTFHSWAIMALEDDPERDGFRLYRRLGGDVDGPWEECEEDDGGHDGFRFYDRPDEAVRAATHKDFTSLRPGESWMTWNYLHYMFPDDVAPNDVFSYGFRGAVVDWWDWGGAGDHAETVVMLPCWIAGRVVDPADNGGRPRLVVPKSGPIDFRVVG